MNNKRAASKLKTGQTSESVRTSAEPTPSLLQTSLTEKIFLFIWVLQALKHILYDMGGLLPQYLIPEPFIHKYKC